MQSFPDESSMPRSADGSEPIRGGSIGFNRILNKFVVDSTKDSKPQFTAVIISAFTIFRNVWSTYKTSDSNTLDEGFVKDINLFLDYYDTYLSYTIGSLNKSQKAPVIIYFPNYKSVPKEILREKSGRELELNVLYDKFLKRYGDYAGKVRNLDHCQCFWIKVGNATYPHKEVAREFRDIVTRPISFYNSGEPVCLITHIPLDLHIHSRIRNIKLLESYTAKIKIPKEFNLRLDKEGRIPFLPSIHVVFGDDVMIKPWVSPKVRKVLFEEAVRDRWNIRSDEDIQYRLVKHLCVSGNTFRKYDFL